MAGSSTSSSSGSATSSTSARSPPPYPQTATRRPAPGAPRTFPGSEPAPPYDSINPPNPSPGFPGVNDDDLPPWYTWGSKPPFFAAISREDVSELQRLIDLDSKIVNTRDSKDRTPLYYATITYKANIEIVRCLLECGANVDDWSTEYLPPQTSNKMEWRSRSHKPRKYKTQRTPLMAACERNHLPIARLLLEAPYNADTKMIAPDGQHALRLASDAGAREIVRLLPSLRAGGWERLKYRSKPHIDKMKKVALAMYKVGKFLVYDLPKFLVREIPKALYHIAKWLLRFLWDSAKGIVRFLIKLPVELFRLLVRIPGAIWRGVRDIWRGVKAAPGLLKTFLTSTLPIFIKDIYEVSRDILVGTVKYSWSVAKWLFKKIFIQIPESIFNGCVALCRKIKDLGEWFLNLLTSFASLLHTFAEWVVRNCTWHNVMQGLNTTLKFFFVDIPVGLWDAVKLIYAGFEHLVLGIFGCFGYVLLLLFRAVMWFPYKFRSILVSCGKMAAEAWKEIRVWIDPKAEA